LGGKAFARREPHENFGLSRVPRCPDGHETLPDNVKAIRGQDTGPPHKLCDPTDLVSLSLTFVSLDPQGADAPSRPDTAGQKMG